MTCYRRVTFEDRCQIKALLISGRDRTEIARLLGFHKSTIVREIKRNSKEQIYFARTAELLARDRFKRCRKRKLLQGWLEQFIREKIILGWSPEQISGRLKLEKKSEVSGETIYKYIRGQKGEPFLKGLRRYRKKGRGRYRFRRERPDWMLNIRMRSKEINERKRFGDWERDTMYAKNREALLVCIERKSRFLRLQKVIKPMSLNITEQTTEMINSTTAPALTLTNDNGGEFRDGFVFKIPVYYCDPQSPHQRGSVENTIGLIRQFIKRDTDLKTMSEEISSIEARLNHRPRKCLDYKTPYEVMYNQTVALVS